MKGVLNLENHTKHMRPPTPEHAGMIVDLIAKVNSRFQYPFTGDGARAWYIAEDRGD